MCETPRVVLYVPRIWQTLLQHHCQFPGGAVEALVSNRGTCLQPQLPCFAIMLIQLC
jgi:hypothetical protein